MGLYGKKNRGPRASTSTNSPLKPGSGPGARKTPTGKRSSRKSESDAVNVSSTAPMPGLSDKRREKGSCPCNQSLGCWKIDCSKCGHFWHVDCFGLTGLDDTVITSLSQYLCPLCFDSPVPTTEPTVDVCHICRNTLSLQHSNLAYTLSEFDSRLKHILLKENSLLGLDTEIKSLSRILTDHKQEDESLHLLNSNISHLQKELLAFSHPNPPPQNALSESSEHLLSDISSKLEALQTNESSITASLSELKHSVESLRSTERTTYRYTGSKSFNKVPPIPESLKPLIEKINNVQSEIYKVKYPDQPYLMAPQINSILINKYEGSNSYLPKHSDREETIHPESSIFTLSLGQRCVVKFTERLTGMEVTQTCPNHFLYTMSRRSQEVYDHEIEQGSLPDGIEYSLIFRSIS
ncbi:hypothetical protein ACHWQZ_G006918 [Mnemiopsis leidyi]